MKPILAISDLHPERGFNRGLYDLLWKYSETHTIIFIGDCLQYPNSYKKVPRLSLQGNHDSDKCRNEYYETDGMVFVHSHQWDSSAETGGLVTDSIWAFFNHLFKAKKIPLGSTEVLVTLEQMLRRPMADAEYARIRDLAIPAVRARFGFVSTLIMGHRHIRYARIINNVTVINCGAGWQGEFVTLDDAGIVFHSFK